MIEKLVKKVKNYIKGKPSIPESTSTVDYSERSKNNYKLNEYNPNILANKKGCMGIYKEMENDDCLARTHDFITKSVSSIPWAIEPGEDTPLAKEQSEFVFEVLNNTKIPTKDCIQNLMNARKYGFQVGELIWDAKDGKIIISNIKCKSSTMFDFDTDEFDNLLPDGLILKNYNRERLSINKFVILVHPYIQDGNYYGTSDFNAVYREWWSKDALFKMRNKAGESYAEPLRDVIYDKSMSTAHLDALKGIINDLHSNLAVYRPGVWNKERGEWDLTAEIKYLETTREPSDTYTSIIDKLDIAMTRRSLIGDQLGQTDTKSGNRALGEVHMDLYWVVLGEILLKIENVYNEQVIKRLIDANWTGTKKYPYMNFKTIDDKITKEKVDIIKIAIDSGLVDETEEWVRPYLNLPILSEEEKKRIEEKKAQAIKDRQQDMIDNADDETEEAEPKDNQELKQNKAKQKFKTETNYKAIKSSLDSVESESVSELVKAFEIVRKDMLWQAQKIIDSGDKRFEVEIKAKDKKNIRNIFELSFMDTMLQGKESAVTEIEKAQKTSKYKYEYSESKKSYKNINVKITGGDIDYIEKHYADKLTYSDRFLRDKQKQRAFYITGVESDNITGKIERILTEGIGKIDNKQIAAQIDAVFNQYLYTGEIDGATAEPARINTIVRTNTTRIFNESRLSAFEDPELNNFVKAFQYDAILDDRTTEYCDYHNGQVVRSGDPRLYVLCPSHYNCRSIWTAIFAGEDFSVDWKDKSGIEAGAGFGL
jgi:SPP1 gp7 family putative phage head morphogenesis protein